MVWHMWSCYKRKNWQQNVVNGSVFISFLSKELWSEFVAYHISIIQSSTRNKKIEIECLFISNVKRNVLITSYAILLKKIYGNFIEFPHRADMLLHSNAVKHQWKMCVWVYECMCVCNTSATANVCVFISIAIHCYIKQYETQ